MELHSRESVAYKNQLNSPEPILFHTLKILRLIGSGRYLDQIR